MKVIIELDSRAVKSKIQVRNPGVLIDSHLSFSSHIKAITKSAFYHLKQIARMRLPSTYRIDFKVLLLVYKSLSNDGPKYIFYLLKEYIPTRALRALGSSQLVEP